MGTRLPFERELRSSCHRAYPPGLLALASFRRQSCGLLRVTTCARVSQTGRRRWTEDWKAINVGGSSDHVLAHARADEAGDATKGENPWEIFDPATRAIPGV